MSWLEELEYMEPREEKNGMEISERQYREEREEIEENEEINNLDDVLRAIDMNFDSLGVLIELKNLGEDVSEGFDIVEERMNDLIKKGKEFGITEKQISNILSKYERMTGFKTNKM